jgi:hypothetical protein
MERLLHQPNKREKTIKDETLQTYSLNADAGKLDGYPESD